MKTKILSLLISLSLLACGERESKPSNVRSTLSRAEALMTQAPDSALMLLEDLSKGALRGRENRAHFALLYSQALDKNYIDCSNDSIIRIAVDYYSTRKKEPEKLFLSYYYLGRVQQNAGNLTRAMLSYGQAEDLIADIQDDYAIGLLYTQMGNLYHAVYDLPKSLDCFQKAYTHYEKADKELHKMYAKRDVGVLYMNMKRFDIAEDCLIEVLNWAQTAMIWKLCGDCIESLCVIYIETADQQKLKQLYHRDIFKVCVGSLLESRIASYCDIGDNQTSAKLRLKTGWEFATNNTDSMNLLFDEYMYNKSIGQYKDALAFHEQLFYAQDTLIRGVLQQPLLSAQRDYFKSQSELNELKLQHNKQEQIFASIILLIIMLGAVVFVRQRMKAKEQEINHYVEKVKDLENR